MKNNLRNKFRDFLASEEGRVGVKSPLTVGVVSASLLLAQVMVSPSAQAHWECLPWDPQRDCDDGEVCALWCDDWSVGTCVGEWHTQCVEPHDG